MKTEKQKNDHLITISNGLSIIRAPLALLFLQDNILIRLAAIFLAMISDAVDGYFARRYHSTSKFGAFLDPAMDKFFVYFVLTVFFFEHSIELWQGLAMISRDIALCIFGVYLFISKRWSAYKIRAIRWGKITTAMQFILLIGLTFQLTFSWYVFVVFILFGILALLELFQTKDHNSCAIL